MNIYLVIRWGNKEEGPDGQDTSSIVVAESHLQASELIDSILAQEACTKVSSFSNDIFEIGASRFHSNEPEVLLRPIVQYFNIPKLCKNWVRYNLEDEWHEVESTD